jgi:dynein heavy chain 2
MEKTKQVMYIIKEIDTFRSVFGLLRTLSSGILERDHWRNFWSILNVNKVISPEMIKLKDMMNFSRKLNEKITQIQDLVSRAQGEATLREALQELAIWW